MTVLAASKRTLATILPSASLEKVAKVKVENTDKVMVRKGGEGEGACFVITFIIRQNVEVNSFVPVSQLAHYNCSCWVEGGIE